MVKSFLHTSDMGKIGKKNAPGIIFPVAKILLWFVSRCSPRPHAVIGGGFQRWFDLGCDPGVTIVCLGTKAVHWLV